MNDKPKWDTEEQVRLAKLKRLQKEIYSSSYWVDPEKVADALIAQARHSAGASL